MPSAISKRLAQLEADARHAAAAARRGAASCRRRPASSLLEHARTRAGHDGPHRARHRRPSAAASRGRCGWSRPCRPSPSRCPTTSRRSCRSRRTATSRSTSRSASRATWCAELREGSAPLGVCWDASTSSGLQTGPTATTSSPWRSTPDHPLARPQVAALRADAGLRARRPASDQRGPHHAAARGGQVGRVVVLSGRGLELRRRVPGRRGRTSASA